jgi:hypothetical protein
MNVSMKSSAHRLWLGAGLAALATAVAIFLLPDASGRAAKERKSAQDAKASLQRQLSELSGHKDMLERIHAGQQRIADLEKHMPKGDVGALQASLRKTLHELSRKSGVRLTNIKFSLPNKDGTRNTGIESLDVEFVVIGVYQNLKVFMHAIESSGQPFGASNVKLDESPEGGRLTVVLRAFRPSSGNQAEQQQGEAP